MKILDASPEVTVTGESVHVEREQEDSPVQNEGTKKGNGMEEENEVVWIICEAAVLLMNGIIYQRG